MWGIADDGHLAAAVEDVGIEGQHVVGGRPLAVDNGEPRRVALQPRLFGFEFESQGAAEAVVVVVDAFLRHRLSAAVAEGELCRVSFQTGGVDGDFHGEGVAREGYAVVAYVGQRGVAPWGGYLKVEN